MGIILEDDCLPCQSFFKYCDETLLYYVNDTRVTAITGNNFRQHAYTENSYFFSRFIYIWGWATWKRSWNSHQKIMQNFDFIMSTPIRTLSLAHKNANLRIIQNAIDAKNGKIDTWDYQWILSNFLNNGLIVTPNVNLVKNIGFNNDATHTKAINKLLIIDTSELKFPLNHPYVMIQKIEYDNYLYNKIFHWESFFRKLTNFKKLPVRILRKLF